MPRSIQLATCGALLVLPLLCGCGVDPVEPGSAAFDEPGNGPFGPPDSSLLLKPFAGRWTFDANATLEARRELAENGPAPDDARTPNQEETDRGELHPDMAITGNVAVCAGIPTPEYRFFALHKHGEKICGKAWHHEDRFDPGDMSKCYVRFEMKDDRLYFAVRMKEAMPEVTDPDLSTPPPVDFGSASACDAENPSGHDWSPWTTFVFSRTKPPGL